MTKVKRCLILILINILIVFIAWTVYRISILGNVKFFVIFVSGILSHYIVLKLFDEKE